MANEATSLFSGKKDRSGNGAQAIPMPRCHPGAFPAVAHLRQDPYTHMAGYVVFKVQTIIGYKAQKSLRMDSIISLLSIGKVGKSCCKTSAWLNERQLRLRRCEFRR